MAYSSKALFHSSNVTQFVQELKDFSSVQLKIITMEVHKQIVMEAIRRLVKRSPVDDGPVKEYAAVKNNWRVTLVHAGTAQVHTQSPIADASAVLKRIKPFQKVFVVNNVEYLNILEYGGFVPRNPGEASNRWGHEGETRVSGGFSTQAPQGWVRAVFEELRRVPTLKVRNFGFKGIRP